MAKKPTNDTIDVLQVRTGRVTAKIIGQTPMICNRMAEKARQQLLMPQGRKKKADRGGMLKHEPVTEFRASVYRLPEGPTLLGMPAPAVKGAMMTAALDIPNVRRTEIGRLAWVRGHSIPLWGVPLLHMGIVRSADINRTPDVRTRAILPQWCSIVTVEFVEPNLSAQAIGNLLAAGGFTSGLGDFRQEKGKGNHGQFRLVATAEDEAEWDAIVAAGGREAQEAGLAAAEPYDDEAAELLEWFTSQVGRAVDTDDDGEDVEQLPAFLTDNEEREAA